MRATILAATLALTLVLTALPAEAGPQWLPVCKDKDVRTGVVNVHVGVDCYPGLWVDVCAPRGECERYEIVLA